MDKLIKKYNIQSRFSRTLAEKLLIPNLPKSIIPVGSYRRGLQNLGDIDLLTFGDIDAALKKLQTVADVVELYANGPERKGLVLKLGREYVFCDLFRGTDKGASLLHFTGSKQFNIRIRAHAKKLGFLLNQHGLFKDNKKVEFKRSTERVLLKKLGISWCEPEDRV
jgi:DNA polymerase (family 10)